VRSIYLRHGLLGDAWIPAVSDIDLTVVFDDLDEAGEWTWLEDFWERYPRLRVVFPMLGEVDVLPKRHVGPWTRHTILGHEAAHWVLLWGEPTVTSEYRATPERVAIDGLNHALLCYQLFIMTAETGLGTLDLVRMARIVAKVQRYAGQGPVDSDVRPPVWQALNALTAAARPFSQVAGQCGLLVSDPFNVAVCKTPQDVPTGLSPAPWVLTPDLFQYTVRYFNPYMFTHLAAWAQVAAGNNPLDSVPPPTREQFAGHILSQGPNLLNRVRQPLLVQARTPGWFEGPELASLVDRVLTICLFGATGAVPDAHHLLLDELRTRFSSTYASLEGLRRAGSLNAMRRAAFALLWPLLDEVAQCL
jgi:hypothetical protein